MTPEVFNHLWNALALNINWVIVLIVIGSGYFQKRYLTSITFMNEALKTLLVSFLAATIYMWLIGALQDKLSLAQYFFSYFISTSLYEVLLKPLTRWVENKLKPSE